VHLDDTNECFDLDKRLIQLRQLFVVWRPKLAHIPEASHMPMGWGASETELAETALMMQTAAWLHNETGDESDSDIEEIDLQLEETLDMLMTRNAYHDVDDGDADEDVQDSPSSKLPSSRKRPRFV
jgi:hypothetical protein